MSIFGKILFVVLLIMFLTPMILGGIALGWWAFFGFLLFGYMWIGFLIWLMAYCDGDLGEGILNNAFVFMLTWAIRPLI